ncbi:serine protease [Modestobacter sp. NPDC049651]|uniref:S1C family serine protease n=1 Tax=unclassified Modestobacter TaxID=2643866 RepID=UPI003406F2BD
MRVRRVCVLGATGLLVAGCSPLGGDAEVAAATVTVTAPAPSAPSSSPASSSRATASSSTSSSAPAPSSSAPPPTLQQAFERVRSGVVRFEVATCDGNAIGSGFELSPTLVATAAHVVDGGQVIRIIQGTTSTAGTVIGIDPGADVALVRTATQLTGHPFTFAGTSPAVGDQVAAIGFPMGDPLSYNTGTVNGLGRKAVVDGLPRHDLLEMDAAVTHGSSGGPVIRPDGAVVGLVDAGPDGEAGRRLAVSSATARPLVDGWAQSPQPVLPGDCAEAVDEAGDPLPPGDVPTRADLQAVTTLDVYFRAVNGGDFTTAVAQLAHPVDLETFTEGVTSTQDVDITYRSVAQEGEDLVVWATFTSHQDAGRGPAGRPQETCTDWSLDYVLAQRNGLWLIDATRPHDGPASAPCAAG